MKKESIINCLHFNQLIITVELNCGIFRCGILKSNQAQINPNSYKSICDDFTSNNLIYGCGKQYLIDAKNKALICDYI